MGWRAFAVVGPDERRRAVFEAWRLPERLLREGLDRRLDLGSISLFVSPPTPLLRLEAQQGAIVGRIFPAHGEPAEALQQVGAAESAAIVMSRGRRLVDLYWGPHIALLSDGAQTIVQRDPSGGLAAYWFELDGLTLFATDPDLLIRLGLAAPQVDDEFVRQWLVYPHLRTARTGLKGVRELLPGTVWVSGEKGERIEARWTPWTFAAANTQLGDFEDARRRLRAAALRTIPACAAGARKPLLELSGGLDSSIIASALGAAGIDFAAVNFATVTADGDERHYARMAAAAAGAPLVELIQQDAAPDLLTVPPRRLRPGLSPVLQPIHDGFRSAALELGADLFVSGAGGDSLFCYLTTASPAVDATATLGLRAGLSSLADVSRLCGCTFWTAARFALRKALRGHRSHWRKEMLLLSPALDRISPDPHPWLAAPPHALPGKREHVEALVTIFHFLDRGARGPLAEAAYPLMSQPLLELCLRIPSWMWVQGGRNRAVAREAFAGLVPAPILARGGKGRLESMCVSGYLQNRLALRSLLLDGALARARLIDRPALEAYLRLTPVKDDPRYFRVFDLATLELWLRSWGAA